MGVEGISSRCYEVHGEGSLGLASEGAWCGTLGGAAASLNGKGSVGRQNHINGHGRGRGGNNMTFVRYLHQSLT